MKCKISAGAIFLMLILSHYPTLATACTIHDPPHICSSVARDPTFWIGEYEGEEDYFSMTLNGVPFDPERETNGTMTIFALSDALGFSGGGAFVGEADLVPVTGDSAIDPSEENHEWGWLFEASTFEHLQEERERNRNLASSHISNCALRQWPRWTAEYQPPGSPLMNLALVATSWDTIIGRAYYSGESNGVDVNIDSRFFLVRSSADLSGWFGHIYPSNFEECTAPCPDNRVCTYETDN